MQNIKEHFRKVGQKFSNHHWFRVICRECFIIPKQLQYEEKCVGHLGPLCLYMERGIWGGSSGWSGGWVLQLLHIRVPLLQLWAKQKHIWPLLWPTGLITNSVYLSVFLSKKTPLICFEGKWTHVQFLDPWRAFWADTAPFKCPQSFLIRCF